MSSNYVLICASHDPAVEIHDTDVFASPNDALAAANARTGYEFLTPHQNCDLLVGRFNYPLTQVACPGSIWREFPPGTRCPGYHRHDIDTWTDAGWLRLLHIAYQRDPSMSEHGMYGIPACWTKQRVTRLGRLLGITGSES